MATLLPLKALCKQFIIVRPVGQAAVPIPGQTCSIVNYTLMSSEGKNKKYWWIMGVLVLVLLGRYLYMKPVQKEGEKLPPLEAIRLDGQPFSLEKMRGRYVVLDFWGSWCGPCRRANPELVALYQQFGQASFADAAGFSIVSVGIEEDKDRWLNAINRDGLVWPDHILDLSSSLRFFNSPIAAAFGIRQVPTTYFIGPSGDIIAINLPPDQIRRYLETKM
jgi:thiol-disulfide isomerase/thioredoxin